MCLLTCLPRAPFDLNLYCWLARRTKTEVPAEFLEVAEKARFSHHKLSREERQPLQDHADQLTRQLLADKRFWRQFIYRVIYALG